jgi:hypothetical protein
VVALYVALTDTPDRASSSGMYAFGDSLLFLGVFTVAAIPASIALLIFSRPYRWFWTTASAAAVTIALVAMAGLTTFWTGTPTSPTTLDRWLVLAGASVLIAPLFVLAFGTAGVFAPNRPARLSLFGSAAVEAGVFGVMVARWIYSAIIHR